MQLLNVTNLPIYLPRDTAQVPFGEPFSDVAVTSGAGAAPASFVVAGYVPTNNDTVQLSYTSGGSLPSTYTVGTTYYVVNANANGSFELATTPGGVAANSTGTGAGITMHLLTDQEAEIPLPFKPGGGTVVCVNQSAGTLVLQGAADTGAGYGDPAGPGAWTQIASLAAGSMAQVALNYDWIRVSTSGILSLLQN